jgi:hypothetical protein
MKTARNHQFAVSCSSVRTLSENTADCVPIPSIAGLKAVENGECLGIPPYRIGASELVDRVLGVCGGVSL